MVDSSFISSLLAGVVSALIVGGLLALIFWRWITETQGKITEIEKKLIQRLPPGRKASLAEAEQELHAQQLDSFMPWWSGPARVPSSIKPGMKPRPVILITDMGGTSRDMGDMVAIVLLRGLENLGFVTLRGVVVSDVTDTTATPCVNAAVDLVAQLGFTNCRVACSHSAVRNPNGSNSASFRTKPSLSTESPHSRPQSDRHSRQNSNRARQEKVKFHDVNSLLKEVLDNVEDHSLLLINVCSLNELASVVMNKADILAKKLERVCLFGQVLEPFLSQLDVVRASLSNTRDFFLKPDPTHVCFSSSTETLERAEYVMTKLQDLGIGMTIVSRHTAYEGSGTRDMYDHLARLNVHALRGLRQSQRTALESLFDKVTAPLSSEAREGLPDRCDRAWFADTMCAGIAPHGRKDVWNNAATLPMYDCVTILAGVHETARSLFELSKESEYDCGTAVHLLFGESANHTGVRDGDTIRRVCEDLIRCGSTSTMRPYPVVIFTDPGQDLDDELSLVLLRHLSHAGHLRPIAVVANLAPSVERARLAKGTLKSLGLPDVPVAAGTDGGFTGFTDHFVKSANEYFADESEIERDWQAMVTRVLEKEDPASVLFVCLSSLKDAQVYFENKTELCLEKVHSFTVMGGVDPPESRASRYDAGSFSGTRKRSVSFVSFDDPDPTPVVHGQLLEPDSANNNTFDMEAASKLYTQLQEKGMRFNILSRHAAYAAPVNRAVYDHMAATKHVVAHRLMKVQRESIEELWKRANAVGSARRGLPDRCDPLWFRQTFLNGSGKGRSSNDD